MIDAVLNAIAAGALAVFNALDALFAIDLIDTLFSGIIPLLLGLYISGTVNRLLRRSLSKIRGFDRTFIPFIATTVRYVIIIIAVVISLASFGVEVTSLIAILGAAGLAIGLALQGTLANVAAGVMILFLRPFKVGDWVETDNQSGIVGEIGLFTTEIITFDNVFISMPNSSIWGATIVNQTRNATRRMDVDIGIAYDTDFDLAEKTMLALAKDDRVLPEPAPQFLVVAYGDSAITVRLRLHAGHRDYFPLYWDIMRNLKPALDKAGIEIPFPQRVITPLAPAKPARKKPGSKKTIAKKPGTKIRRGKYGGAAAPADKTEVEGGEG